jgi:arginine exporter protein ArgO
MAVFTAIVAYRWEVKWVVWVFVPIAILFNPFFPIFLTKGTWRPIDIVCAIVFGISAFMLRKPLKVKP